MNESSAKSTEHRLLQQRRAVEHWSRKLQGNVSLGGLTEDERSTTAGEMHHCTMAIPELLARRVRSIANDSAHGVFVFLLSAVQSVLYRQSGASDFLVAMPPFANGDSHGTAYPLALRTAITAETTFRNVLERARAEVVDAHQHRHAADDLVRAHRPDLLGDREKPFRTLVSLDAVHGAASAPNAFADVAFVFETAHGGLGLTLHYDARLFRASTMEDVGAHVLRLLETVATHPDRPIEEPTLVEGEKGAPAEAKAVVPPRDAVEERLLAIWKELLHVETMSVEQSFFSVGGHSLQATALPARIAREFGVEIPLIEVFARDTIARQADYIRHASTAAPVAAAPEIDAHVNVFPLSAPQRRVFVLSRLDEAGFAYNMPVALTLRGALDLDRWQEAVRTIVQRHESLRTSFGIEDGKPVQRIHPRLDVSIEPEELDGRPLDAVLTEFIRPFDLETAPLFRTGLIRIADDEHLFLFDVHHSVCDGVSLRVLIRELGQLYSNQVLEAPPVQYRDVVGWQPSSASQQEDERHWLSVLSGELPRLELPLDYARPAEQSFEGDRVRFSLDAQERQSLEALARRSDATLYMLLLAAYSVLLHKYTGQTDILVGAPVAGRHRPHLENVVGMLVNTVVMRARTVPSKGFAEFLREVRDNCVQALSHADAQFDAVIDKLNLPRDVSRNALFDTMFAFQKFGLDAVDAQGLHIAPRVLDVKASKFDIACIAYEKSDELVIELEYCTRLFRPRTIEQLAIQFKELVRSILASPEASLDELSPMSADERQRVVYGFNQTQAPLPAFSSVHQAFEARVAECPKNVALAYRNQTMTYASLNGRANQVAHWLREQGVKKNQIVAILADASPELVIGLLAILKCGAAYLPIKPSFPDARIRTILQDSGAALLLTQRAHGQRAVWDGPAGELDDLSLYEGSRENVGEGIGPHDLAYVIYTSGSTGTPKGVPIEHGALVNLLCDLQARYPLMEGDTHLLKTPFSFDVSLTELFGWFWGRGRLAILDAGDEGDPQAVARAIENYGVTHINFVSSMLHAMLHVPDPAVLAALEKVRYVFNAGEALNTRTARQFLSLLPGVRLENVYGPTEATVYGTAHSVREAAEGTVIPIGKPIANVRAYVLDPKDRPCPIGVVGDLVLAGYGVARGYLGRDELTREKFLNDPFVSNERMYRTGDKARWLPDGTLEFLGRTDDQIKIRGHRIELKEIESQLLLHDAVREAAVALKEDPRGDGRLCAYYVADREISDVELREHLARTLPDVMVPRHFGRLERLPRNSSGKVDAKALPLLTGRAPGTTTTARSPVEGVLADTWRVTLGLASIGPDEDFFAIGGDSIRAIEIASRLRAHGIVLNLKDLFRHSTLRTLAEFLDPSASRPEAPPAEAPAVETPPAASSETAYERIEPDAAHLHEPFPLTDIQMAYLVGRSQLYELGGVATQVFTELEGKLDMPRFSAALRKLIVRHPMLRAVVHPDATQSILEHVPDYDLVVEDLRGLTAEARERHLSAERTRMSDHVFVTDQWPLFEFKAFRLDDERYALFASRDLLVVDGASMGLLGAELVTLYETPNAVLPPLDFTFRDYVLGHERLKSSEIAAKDEAYWLSKLADFPQAPALPLKQDPASVTLPTFGRVGHMFDARQWAELKRIAQAHRVTSSALLCTAYAQVLAFWSNQSRLAINLTIFNRYPFHEDVGRVVGDFTSNALLGLELAPHTSFWQKAEAVQELLFDALAHRHYEGVRFIRELARARSASPRQALMPVVLTSTLFGANRDIGAGGWERLGEIKPGVTKTSQVYLDHQVTEINGELAVFWDYVEDLFEPDTIRAMFAQYIDILQTLLDEKDVAPLCVGPAHEAWVAAYNATQADIPASTLHGLFMQQAQRTPDAVAVRCGDEELTYRELDERSNQVALYLGLNFVQRGNCVGVVARRHPMTMVNILGILKANAAYVPIDPDYPEERQKFIARHCGAEWVLDADLDPCHLSRHGTARKEYPDDVAYVIYTSGSTGRPKGVVITHRAAANTVLDINQRYDVKAGDRILGLSSLCFDLSVYDVFGAFSTGATLVQIPDQRDVLHLAKVLRDERITFWNSVPAILDMLVDGLEADFRSDSLRTILLSGDWIGLTLPDRARKAFPKAQVISLGGATEASIWSIYYPIEQVRADWKSIPYGMPLANQSFYVLNHELELCPIGTPGELYIGGVGVALGYLHDEEKTQNAFLVHPRFGRLYKTGDHGVWHHDGYIEFLGRRDQQVKIRGYRVELGEIETRLLEHPAIRQAVVVDRLDARGRKSLCAYAVIQGDVSAEALVAHLSVRLPEYMVPSNFVAVDTIPLTANGKVDRRSLPDPDTDESEDTYEAPRDALEQSLQVIWQEVLKVERIGIHDNFLELRGDSLTMVQIRTRIHRELEAQLEFRDFMERNTIAKVADKLRHSKGTAPSAAYLHQQPNPADVHVPFPLTDVQMAYLMGRSDHFEMGGVSTHGYAEIETRLDMARFNRSLQKLIDRHPMMRAVFSANGEQRILDSVPQYRMVIEDLRAESPEVQHERILKERARMSHHVFSPAEWPLFEFKAFRLDDERSYLFIGYDLLIADGASMQLIVGPELLAFYGDETKVPEPLAFTFRDYLIAYHEFKKTSEVYAADKAYWLSKAPDFPEAPALPMKQDPSQVTKPTFRRLTKSFDRASWVRLKKLAQANQITPSALLCAAYAEVLVHWSNQPRLAINLTVFNRYPFHPDVDQLVGDFTSVMMVGIERPGGVGFWDRAAAVQRAMMDALEHRHYEGVEFIRDLAKQRGVAAGKAIMPVVFTSMLFGSRENESETGVSAHDMGSVAMSVSQTSQVFLDHQVMENRGGLLASWDYVEDLFEAETLEAMFAQYIGILQGLLDGADVGSLQVDRAHEDWVTAYNTTQTDIPASTLHGLFVQQVQKTPELVAVRLDEETLTYRELDARSNQVAHLLMQSGIGRGDLVGVLAHRRPSTLVHILGVLKAGAAYVPIDPDYPQDRQDYIISHCAAKRRLDADLSLDGYPRTPPKMDLHPDDVAYVIYTSGSTGRPKGVVITHAAAANTVIDINQRYDVKAGDRILGLSSLCFDLSVYDVFGSFSTGATLVQIPDQRDVLHLAKVLRDEGITFWNSVPAILDMLVDGLEADFRSDSLRTILLSGDWIGMTLPDRARKPFPKARIISLGGATEASIWSIYYPIEQVRADWKSIPYGMPLANQSFYVLNHELEICPIGTPGELYIGGVGVALGYLHDEEKTQNAFFVHPRFGRLYKTGDHGVWRQDGYIEFLGRRDQQVKIRGYRVELGEIETRLLEHPVVRQAVVVDRLDARGRKSLCAYVIVNEEISVDDLIEHLSARVPEYMVPTGFVGMDAIPLTANGKVDRRSLPDPDADELEDTYEAPRDELEQSLQVIWQEVLKVERIGIHDNFLELGGDSLAMVQIRTRLHRELEAQLEFRDFMERNTIAKVADKLRHSKGTGPSAAYLHQQPNPADVHVPFPLTDVQMAYLMGRSDHFEMGGISTHGYAEIETGLDMARFGRSVQKLIERHPMLRSVFSANGEQRILESVPQYDMVIEDLRTESPEVQRERILKERARMSHHVFSPAEWPLFEFKAFRLDDERSYLFIGYDLLIADGASMQLVIGPEIMAYYENPDYQPEPLPFTFRDYIVAYHEFKKTSEVYAADKAHWLAKAPDFPEAPALPMKQDPAQIGKPTFRRLSHSFDRTSWARLKRLAQEKQVTPSALLCTAFGDVLAFWSNRTRLAINLTVFNRYPFHPDVDKLVGDFTSLMLIDIERIPGRAFWEQAASVQHTLMDALEHRHYEGVEFIRELGRQRGIAPGKAIMPIVFTSMLFGSRDTEGPEAKEMGSEAMSVSQTSQVFLDHQVMESRGALAISWDYVEDLFEAETLEAMFAQYIGILQGLVDGSEVGGLQVGRAHEAWVAAYNATQTDIPASTLHGLFARQAQKTPANVAVQLGGEALTYRELDARSNRVARALRQDGIGRGDFVGVRAHRKPETLVHLLGILKAGAAYVPVDPDYPADRQDYIVSHSGAKRMLDGNELGNTGDDTPLPLEEHPDDIAYVIYTSGSTGRPKGVVIQHGAAANTIVDVNQRFGLKAGDRVLGLSSLCFDLSVYDVFGSLSTGATLVQIPDPRDMAHIANVLRNDGITFWNSVPAILDMLVESLDAVGDTDGVPYWHAGPAQVVQYRPFELRSILLSGDWIGLTLPDRARRHFPEAEIVSLGGATEASIWSIYYPITEVRPEWKSVPYGIPMANQTFYVLNHEMKLCPPGVPGELYIGGVGLAMGYLNDAEKTNAAFQEHPRWGRLYKTGDYGAWRAADGTIEFLGRRDQQVKIRGFRVELGEIETRLLGHPDVQQTVVTDRADPQGRKFLAAYVVSERELDVPALKAFLEERLPEYMVPSYFARLDAIPLNANGKVDKKQLPASDGLELPLAAFVAPENELEATLADIWKTVLALDSLSVTQNLFDLGVQSANVISFVSQARAKLKRDIAIAPVFGSPTVRAIARLLSESQGEDAAPREYELLTPNRPQHVFAFPPVVAMGLAYQGMARHLQHRSLYSFNFVPGDDRLERYADAITSVQPHGPYVLFGYSAGGNVAFEVAKVLEARGLEVSNLILMDSFYVDEVNPNRITDEQGEKYANETVDYLLETYPDIKVDPAAFKSQWVPRIRSYYTYLDDLINSGKVRANIHLIRSTGAVGRAGLRGDAKKWTHCTDATFVEHRGSGEHEKMLDGDDGASNAAIIDAILSQG